MPSGGVVRTEFEMGHRWIGKNGAKFFLFFGQNDATRDGSKGLSSLWAESDVVNSVMKLANRAKAPPLFQKSYLLLGGGPLQ